MKQYDLFELIWKAQAPENSDVKADLQADFLYEDGEIVKVKGFYAGAETYKVRFLPVKTGKIMWKISGIINEEGTEFCEPTKMELVLSRRLEHILNIRMEKDLLPSERRFTLWLIRRKI